MSDAVYQKVRRARIRLGETRLVDAGPARAHCLKLRAMNIGYRQIAGLADVNRTTVQRLCAGTHQVIRRDVAEKILAVPPKPALGIRVVAHDTWRLIRLIKKELYEKAEIAALIGRDRRLRIGRKFCELGTALHVRRLYRSTQPEDEADE